MNVRVGGPARVPPNLFRAHLECVLSQEADANLHLMYVLNGDHKEGCAEICDELGVEYQLNDFADASWPHQWTLPKLDFVAEAKQAYLDSISADEAWWMVDADLLCHKHTLRRLLDHDLDVVSGCYWTRWQPDQMPAPNAWMRFPSQLGDTVEEARQFYQLLAAGKIVEVAGSGGCTLFRGRVAESCRYFPRLPYLPKEDMWQGEDRTMALNLIVNDVPQYLDGGCRIWHCYREEHRTDEWIGAALADLVVETDEFRLPPVLADMNDGGDG